MLWSATRRDERIVYMRRDSSLHPHIVRYQLLEPGEFYFDIRRSHRRALPVPWRTTPCTANVLTQGTLSCETRPPGVVVDPDVALRLDDTFRLEGSPVQLEVCTRIRAGPDPNSCPKSRWSRFAWPRGSGG
jgi:hypothetical protein